MTTAKANKRPTARLQQAVDKIAWHARNIRAAGDRQTAERSAIQIESLCLAATLTLLDLADAGPGPEIGNLNGGH